MEVIVRCGLGTTLSLGVFVLHPLLVQAVGLLLGLSLFSSSPSTGVHARAGSLLLCLGALGLRGSLSAGVGVGGAALCRGAEGGKAHVGFENEVDYENKIVDRFETRLELFFF